MERRTFLKGMGTATLALAAGRSLRADEPPKSPAATADSIIFLWMSGGMAQTETFDPKNYVAFDKGVEVKRVLSSFPSIPTSLDGVKFCEGMENLAKVMHHGTLIRSNVTAKHDAEIKADGKIKNNLNHLPCQQYWQTGYMPPQTVAAPHMGAIVSSILGPRNKDLPAFIDLARSEKNAKANLATQTFSPFGFLGSDHAPLCVPDPKRASEIIRSRLDAARFQLRHQKYKEMMAAGGAKDLSESAQKEGLVRAMDGAYQLLNSPESKAFDLALEPKDVFERYNTGSFGQGCLLARRLVEARARFVQVNVDFSNAEGWDTHGSGHAGVAKMKKAIDAPVAQLVADLHERGLLKRTLVVLATEFGRATFGSGTENQPPKMESEKHYGMHGHFGDASCCLMFGGGIKSGFVYGKTADEYPCVTVEKPVELHDLHATIYRALGISPKHSFEVEKRPFYVTKDGIGKPVGELFA